MRFRTWRHAIAADVEDAGDAIEDAWLEATARQEAAVALVQYEANEASQLDVIVAERDALKAEVARVQADANLELARALLRLASAPAPASKP